MTKQVFIDELRQALAGEVSSEVMMDAYRYYSGYIDEEMQKGRGEEEIIEQLGRPSLIARSIIAAHTGARVADEEYTEDGKTRRIRNKKEKQQKEKAEQVKKPFVFRFNAWYAKLLYALIFILLVMIVFFIIKVGFWVLITFGIPIMIILGIVYLFLYFTK